MELNRRNVFKGLFAGAGALILPTRAAFGADFNKFHDLVKLQLDIIAQYQMARKLDSQMFQNPYSWDGTDGERVQASDFNRNVILERPHNIVWKNTGNQLISLLHDEFNVSHDVEFNFEDASAKVNEIFKNPDVIDTYNAHELAQHINSVVTIATIRRLMRFERIPLAMTDNFRTKLSQDGNIIKLLNSVR